MPTDNMLAIKVLVITLKDAFQEFTVLLYNLNHKCR